jgi:hypothetical protein
VNALRLRRDPLRLALSHQLRACLWYLLAYQVLGWVLAAVALAVAIAGTVFSFTLLGLPVLIAAAAVLRWCAGVERARLRTVDTEPIAGRYREAAAPGVLAAVAARWKDPATWRDLAFLFGLFVPLVTLEFAVLTVWLVFLVGITLPAWYWAPWQSIHGTNFHGYELGVFPNGPHAHPAYGFYIDTLPKALIAAAIFLVLFLLFNYVVVATARLHAATVRAVLGAPTDPLDEAKGVLRRSGPLSGFMTRNTIPNGR